MRKPQGTDVLDLLSWTSDSMTFSEATNADKSRRWRILQRSLAALDNVRERCYENARLSYKKSPLLRSFIAAAAAAIRATPNVSAECRWLWTAAEPHVGAQYITVIRAAANE